MKDNRIALWDNLRFFLVVLVVIGHFAENTVSSHLVRTVFLFIYSFHMPAFIFISGLFHKNKNIAQKVCANLALYVLLKAFIFSERALLGAKPAFHLFTEKGIPWFMLSIAIYQLSAYLLRDVDRRFLLLLSIVTACYAGYDSAIGDTFVLSRTLVYFPFYLAGTGLKREDLTALRTKKNMRLLAAGIVLVWGLVCLLFIDRVYWMRPLFTGRNPFGAELSFGGAWRLVCYAVSAALVFSCVMLAPERKYFFTVFGKRTLQVYFWHRLVIYWLASFQFPARFNTLPRQLVWLSLGAALAVLLSLKPFGFLTDAVIRWSGKSGEKPASDAE